MGLIININSILPEVVRNPLKVIESGGQEDQQRSYFFRMLKICYEVVQEQHIMVWISITSQIAKAKRKEK